MLSVIPMHQYEGSSVTTRFTTADGNVSEIADGGEITAKEAPTNDKTSFTATTIAGDAIVAGITAASHGGDMGALVAYEIASKAREMGRTIAKNVAGTNAAAINYNSLASLVDAGQVIDASGINGGVLQPEHIWDLMAKTKGKDGEVDFLMGSRSVINRLKRIILDLGGVNENLILTLPNGVTRNVFSFEGVPVFANDNMLNTEAGLDHTSLVGATHSLYAGCFDTGDIKTGLSFIAPSGDNAGISVKALGELESFDRMAWRIKVYQNLALFNKYSLTRLHSIV
jgi:hypothetical protein